MNRLTNTLGGHKKSCKLTFTYGKTDPIDVKKLVDKTSMYSIHN